MKLCIVYGTRPEYLKVQPLIKKLNCKVIRVFQHTDIIESDLEYDYFINISNTNGNRLDLLGSEILSQLGKVIIEFSHVVVQGDTATAFYSALCAFQNKVKVIHLEAGLRTYDSNNPYPEESYRQMISRITDIHLCPHQENAEILKQERVQGSIHVVGNTILDVVKSYDLTTQKGNTVLITFHRRENLEYLNDFINQLKECIAEHSDKQFIWFLHPNKELQKIIKNTNLNCKFEEPRNHRDFLDYIKHCYCVLTDSGGIQEECAYLGKPIIVLRKYTERDQIKEPYLFLVKPPYTELKNTFNKLPTIDLEPCYVYGNGETSSEISEILKTL